MSCSSQKIWSYKKDHRPFTPGQPVVLVGGCFDLFHYGHLAFLKAAKKPEGQKEFHLVIALESDEAILTYKKKSPIHCAKQRAEILAALYMVDEIVILPLMKGYEDYFEFVQSIRPQIIAVTEGDPQQKNKEKQMAILKGKVVVVTPLIDQLSSSRIARVLGIN